MSNNEDVEEADMEIVQDSKTNQQPARTTLFKTDEPDEVMEQAKELANPLAQEIDDKDLYSTIQGNRHVNIEGWTMLGSMVGVYPETVHTNHVEYGDAQGFEAKVNAVTKNGQIVGSAEAMCMDDEPNWKGATLQELRSMAQTRAASKALRMPLGYIVQLAGFNATPAEEMGNVENRQSKSSSSSNNSGEVNPSEMKMPFGDEEGKPLTEVSTDTLEWFEGEYLTGDKLEGKYGENNKRMKQACQKVLGDRQSDDDEEQAGMDNGERSELKAEISAYAECLPFDNYDDEWSVYVQNTAEKLSMNPDEYDIPALKSIRNYLKECDEGKNYLRLQDDDTFPVEV